MFGERKKKELLFFIYMHANVASRGWIFPSPNPNPKHSGYTHVHPKSQRARKVDTQT
jgi:hypothetical protein